jgi:hypothetical protein
VKLEKDQERAIIDVAVIDGIRRVSTDAALRARPRNRRADAGRP